MIKVHIPATSVSLGVSCDHFGLALDDFMTVTFEVIAESLETAGCEEAYCNEEDLFYQALVKGLQYMGKSVSGAHTTMDTDISYVRGPGSSTTRIVAGLTGANALFRDRMSRYEFFDPVTQMEGHLDNAAPAIFDGLCASSMEDGRSNMTRHGIRCDLLFVAMIPDHKVSTRIAWEVLPDTMGHQDAVYQVGRCVAPAEAIEIGNVMIMRKACTDQMQKLYRKRLIMEYENTRNLCRETDMIITYTSGSRSTMIAPIQEGAAARVLIEKIKNQYPPWGVRILCVTYDGMQNEVY